MQTRTRVFDLEFKGRGFACCIGMLILWRRRAAVGEARTETEAALAQLAQERAGHAQAQV